MPDVMSLIPEITDDDIQWVSSLMGLDYCDESRRRFLKCRSSIDVSACPGSGKTTLIVAKLAILVKKWPYRTKGICVLSHTNVARDQIERRLGRTVVGHHLLCYPHYIDTIHGFTNRFLALPWLYSNGYPSPTIDDEMTHAIRRRILGEDYWGLNYFLSRKYNSVDQLRICDRELRFNLRGKHFPAKPHTPSYRNAKRAVEAAAESGYFCYDEMFVWADALIEDYADVSTWFMHRFPFVMVDEMQDTSNRQTVLLNTIFPLSSTRIVVQRVGDPNQEIFDSLDSSVGAPDRFRYPNTDNCHVIPTSFRFGARIAQLASPFAIQQVGDNGLLGVGPMGYGSSTPRCGHAIFVFPDGSSEGVLAAYGKHTLSLFDDEMLDKGAVTAVGHVHQLDPDVAPGHDHFPKSVGHYWDGYDAVISQKDPHPITLVQYILVAQKLIVEEHVFYLGVEKMACAVLELARRIGDIGVLKRKARKHRTIVEVLEGNEVLRSVYNRLLIDLLVDRISLTEENWPSFREGFISVATALVSGGIESAQSSSFLAWPQDQPTLDELAYCPSTDSKPNVFRVNDGTRFVDIRVGSIHSVKGQTHLATLLLSTYWHKHSAHRLMPWLLGERVNGNGVGTQDRQRLLHAYVAMTRPSHLLCLAVSRSSLGGENMIEENTEVLKNRGWQVAHLVNGEALWQE